MNFLSYLRVELRRAFLSPKTWLVSILTLLTPLIGYGLYQPATQLAVTRSGEFIGNPTLAGAIGGVILFALLTLFELDRVHKSGTDRLTDTIVSPLTMYLTRMLSLLAAATATGLLTAIIYLPYTFYKVGYLFDWSTYFGCWFLIFLPALWIGCLLAAVFYQLTRRFDLSLVLVIAAAIPCFTQAMQFDFILRWINPDVPFLSDMFGNLLVLRMTAWSRLFWIAALAGLYIITNLCVRSYGQGACGSLRTNSKRVHKPVLGAVCVVLAVGLYVWQPFVSRAAPGIIDDETWYFIQDERSSPFSLVTTNTGIDTLIEPDLENGTLRGATTWHFGDPDNGRIVPQRPVDNPFKMYMQINKGLNVHSITVNGEPVKFYYIDDNIMDSKFVAFDMPYSSKIELAVEYSGHFVLWRSDAKSGLFGSAVTPQYLHLSSGSDTEFYGGSRGLPPNLWGGWIISSGFSQTPSGGLKRTFYNTLDVVLPADFMLMTYYHDVTMWDGKKYNVISKPFVVSENEGGSKTWRFDTTQNTPVDVFAADYLYERIEAEGMVIDFYYARKNQHVMEKYNVFRTLAEVYEYCTRIIAPQPPNNIVFIQNLGVREIEFSEDSLANQWKPVSGRGTMAYQLIQQWWLEMIFSPARDSAIEENVADIIEIIHGHTVRRHEWNINGITEYISYRFAKAQFGEEYAYANYVEVWQEKARDYYRDFYVRNPEHKSLLSQKNANLLTQQEQALLYYYAMPLKIWKAAQLIGGEDKMDALLAQLYKTAYENRKTNEMYDFLSEVSYEEWWIEIYAKIAEMNMELPPRTTGLTDSYLKWIFNIWAGHEKRPGSSEDYFELVKLKDIFAECGLEEDDWAAKVMQHFFDETRKLYREIVNPPSMYYTDFLRACGLTEEQLELTQEDLVR